LTLKSPRKGPSNESTVVVRRRVPAPGGSSVCLTGKLRGRGHERLRCAHVPRSAVALRSNTNSNSNWFGYNQGTLEQGSKLFNSITGDWTVPTATQHTAGQAEDSSDWIGIGGGFIDAGCTATDSTLIQTGTEQDVDSTGAASYSAWWELVPAPSLTISNMTVEPGDRMHASISEGVRDSDVWRITLQDVTRGVFTQTAPYASTHATAEWIEETPLEIGTDAGFASLRTSLTRRSRGRAPTALRPACKPRRSSTSRSRMAKSLVHRRRRTRPRTGSTTAPGLPSAAGSQLTHDC
jgi:Peptidase A4 family